MTVPPHGEQGSVTSSTDSRTISTRLWASAQLRQSLSMDPDVRKGTNMPPNTARRKAGGLGGEGGCCWFGRRTAPCQQLGRCSDEGLSGSVGMSARADDGAGIVFFRCEADFLVERTGEGASCCPGIKADRSVVSI